MPKQPTEERDSWDKAITPPRRDPLAIDLDADGIETLGIPSNGSAPILFDHDADGVRTGTGWLSADDGWLVMDRDGNGSIDSGRELFGVDTFVPSLGRNAYSGFEALAGLDTGSGSAGSAGYGDKLLDSRDAAFAQVRVWRDLNQDGISQAGELQTLAAAGIASISLQPTTATTNLGNGNTVTGTAGVTRSDGNGGQVDSVDLTAGNLNLGSNPFYRQFPDTIPRTDTALALPEMGGSGWLRDLREAMSLGTPEAAALVAAVQAFAAATTRDSQMAALDGLLTAWAATSGRLNETWRAAAEGQSAGHGGASEGVRLALVGEDATTTTTRFTGAGTNVPIDPQTGIAFNFMASYAFRDADLMGSYTDSMGLAYQAPNVAGETWLHRRDVLETFNGQRFIDFVQTFAKSGGGSGGGGGGGGGGQAGATWFSFNVTHDQRVFIEQAYDALRESVFSALTVQTRLRPYLDSIDLVFDESGVRFDNQTLAARLAQAHAASERDALLDLADLCRYAMPTLDAVGYDGISTLRGWIEALPAAATLRAELVALGVFGPTQTTGRAAADIFLGDAAANTFAGGEGGDVVDGGAGVDTLKGEGGSDTLRGGADADVLSGGAGDDTLDGGAGNDKLGGGTYDEWNGVFTGTGNDTYLFGRGDGQDVIRDNDSTAGVLDRIVFKAGVLPADIVVSRATDDLVLKIAGTTDQVSVFGYFANDGATPWSIEQIAFTDAPGTTWTLADLMARQLVGGAGSDTITGFASDDVLSGGDGNDYLYARAGNDTLTGDAGADNLNGEDGNDLLQGGTGADSLYGGNGVDQLQGGTDNDLMSGGSGDDTLDGGAGNDKLGGGTYDEWNGVFTGTGNDTYLFGRGDGQDVIRDYDGTAGVVDRIVFKAGVLPSDVLFSRATDDLVLKIAGTSDQLTVYGYFANDGATPWSVEQILFTDAPGTVWTLADLKARQLVGGTGNDTITGYASDDSLSGGDGNDYVYGRAGNDWVSGDAGADNLNGEDGNDLLQGGAGADLLYGGNGVDRLEGGADNDLMSGGAGDDTLDGGAGNDKLGGGTYDEWNGVYSGTGNDTYLFGRGDGQDVIRDYDSTAGVVDRIVFKAGVLPSDVTVSRATDDLVLKIAGTTDQITVYGYFAGDGTTPWSIEQIQFTDAPGTTWMLADLKARQLVGGTANDTISGYASDDVLSGGDGNDYLYARAGNDTLTGDAGADYLNGEDGNDLLQGGAGGDSLYGGNGIDQLQGGADNDLLSGGAGDDTLDGGAGNDKLGGGSYDEWNGIYTGTGNDSYLFGRGDGQDVIREYDSTAGVVDRIVFKAGVLPADVTISRTTDDLVLKIAGTTDQISIYGYFANDGATPWTVEQITFTDAPGTLWTLADMKARQLVGSTGNDTITGYASDDMLTGSDGNDYLYGRAGNDNVSGDAGADVLYGEDGNDSMAGGAGADSLYGANGVDTLQGGADNDLMSGGAGDDTLDGGAGNDKLGGGTYDEWNGVYTGTGNDSYLFGRGDGQDIIRDYDGTAGVVDRIVFKAGVLPSDVTVSRSTDDLVLKITGTTDQISVYGYFANDGATPWSVEQITFADAPGTVWTLTDMKARQLVGNTGNDTITGYASDDALTGSDGNDYLYARAGNDTLTGDAGADNLNGEDGNDLLQGGTGADSLYGGNGVDQLQGGADNDLLSGGAGDDTLDGGTGNDKLGGGTYDEWNGVYTGTGNDTYLFGRGDGQDIVRDNDSTAGNVDRIVFKAGVLPTDVAATRSGDNLMLTIVGTTDQIQVTNYFASNGLTPWSIEQIAFTDAPGTVWNLADVKARAGVAAAPGRMHSADVKRGRRWTEATGLEEGWAWHAWPGTLRQGPALLAPMPNAADAALARSAQLLIQASAAFDPGAALELAPLMHAQPWQAVDLAVGAR